MLDHVLSTNLVYHNQVNNVVGNEMKFYISNSLTNDPVNEILPKMTIWLRGGKNSR